jgi:ABC-type transporter Mla MlaB component
MAQIRSARRGDMLRVTVSGRLSTRDMGRLEHACAPALTSRLARLELDLRRVTHADATATAVLERISERGARITPSLHIETGTEPMNQHIRPQADSKTRKG